MPVSRVTGELHSRSDSAEPAALHPADGLGSARQKRKGAPDSPSAPLKADLCKPDLVYKKLQEPRESLYRVSVQMGDDAIIDTLARYE